MESISVFVDISKNYGFLVKNADVSRTQKVIYILFSTYLGKA